MKLTKKIKAGALQFVLFIGAVVAVLLMTFMLLSHTHGHFGLKTTLLVSVVKGADYGIKTSLELPVTTGNSITIKSNEKVPIGITVQRDYWGVFEKRTSTASRGSMAQSKTALIGSQQESSTALYVSDKQRPLIIAGSSQITGNAFLPEQGLKMGNIYGNSYHRDRLLYGKKQKSDSLLPELDKELTLQLQLLTDPFYVPPGETVSLVNKKVIKNSFQSPTIIVRDRTVRLRNVQLTGNVIVSATDNIIVESSATLQDVLLLAPKIVIKDWTEGYFQAIATESISVGKKCRLSYPTALIVKKKEVFLQEAETAQPTFDAPSIYIDSYAQVIGAVLALEKTNLVPYTPQIKIDEHAKVIGEVYCTKNLELKGRVNGSVTTDAFIAMENGSVYQNHLYNGQINRKNLDEAYTGLPMENGRQSKKVMKWLY